MAKDLLVTDGLSTQMIASGAKLIDRLERMGVKVKSALWLYLDELRAWRLLVASDVVVTDGPRKLYEKISAANNLADPSEEVVALHDIGAVKPNQEVVSALNMPLNPGSLAGGIRLSRNYVNGIYVEDAYVYGAIP